MFGFLNIKPKAVKHPNEEQFVRAFSKHIPQAALNYVLDLWREHPFNFTIAPSRKTCLGDYRFKNGRHFISVNGDSNIFGFLITLIHEIAHQRVTIEQTILKKRALPHGIEWKTQFMKLMQPLLVPAVFPPDILEVLIPHMQNPAASSTKDPALVRALAVYSPEKIEHGVFLSELEDGKLFTFNGRKFQKIQNRRSRILVECLRTKKRYTIPGIAKVEV